MPCGFFEELFTLHPACLWARETLGLGLKLWTNRHETFSTACIISVVETYLCHNQLVKRQYCLEWLLCHGVFLSGNHGSWNGSIFFFHKSGNSPHISACGDPVLWVSARWGQATEQEQSSTNKVPAPYLSASSRPWSGICGSTAAHPHDLLKAVVGIQGGCSLFLSSQVLWHGLLPAVPDPKAANEIVTWSMKSIIVNRENILSRILGNAIAIELVTAACGSHSGGILSLTPLYIWSKNAFSLSLCSTR